MAEFLSRNPTRQGGRGEACPLETDIGPRTGEHPFRPERREDEIFDEGVRFMSYEAFPAACSRFSMKEEFFRYFGELARIPRNSGDVKKISDWLVAFAVKHGLRYVQDEKFNVVIYKKGTFWMEEKLPVILQGHMDMVCVHLPGAPDPAVEGVFPVTDGKWIWAEGTTLGADNGIAIAYILAVLASDSILHPPLEAVFTVDEEVGMDGAAWLNPCLLQGRTLLNLDSEEEGIFTVGCAGGVRLEMTVPVEREQVRGTVCEVKLDGMEGGHSGIMIALGRANAIKVLSRVLTAIGAQVPIRLLHLDGGQKANAIPHSAGARLLVEPSLVEKAGELAEQAIREEQKRFADTDPDLKGTFTVLGEGEEEAMEEELSRGILTCLNDSPDGVQAWVKELPDLPESSLNLGILRTEETGVKIVTSVRSSVRGSIGELVEQVRQVAVPLHPDCRFQGAYPPWEFRSHSHLQDVCKMAYWAEYGVKPRMEVIHAGLECGLFSDKLPGLDAISFGPEMLDVHSVKERLNVVSARRTWKLLVRILGRM